VGEEVKHTNYSRAHRQQYRYKVQHCLDVFATMLAESSFDPLARTTQFMLAEERVWHKGLEFGLPLAKPGQRLDVESSGSVGLADGSLDVTLKLPIPADLPQDRPLLAALAGKTVSVGIGGVLGAPQVNFNGSIKQAAGEVVTDLIGNVLDEVKRRRAERRAFEPAGPRPGSLFRRVAPPQ
jgi:hypothetical protein